MVAFSLAGAMSASAALSVAFNNVSPVQAVNLQVTGISVPWGTGSIGVNAGIYNLTVDGVPTAGFCIDVSRYSGTYSDYFYAPLASAPLAPAGPMNMKADAAGNIEKLWAAYYGAAVADSLGVEAAALQVAIWEQVALGGGYTVTVSGNDQVTKEAGIMIGNLANLTDKADLQALVSSSGQNYVVPVPEPTTMIAGAGALGLALLGMGRARRTSVVRIG